MIQHISDADIELCECFANALCMSEALFTNYDNLSLFEEGKLAHIRLGQIPLISHEYLIDENPELDEKENFALLMKVANSYVFAGRNFGKTLTEKIDILIALILLEGWPMGITSYDAVHIRGIMEPIIDCLESHPIFKHFKKNVKRSPTYLVTSKTNATVEGVNMNINNKNPGNQFFQKHFKKIWIEEACVDGHTKIRYLDENNNILTNNISYIVNSDLWKKIKVLSYNYNQKKLQWKKIKNIFKNSVKDYKNYKITIQPNSEHSKRTLIVSQKQKIWTDKGYKCIEDINKQDTIYLQQYSSLTQIQKEILVGCLLGDSYLSKTTNCKLVFTQGKKQKDYLDYKKKCFNNIFQTFKKRKNINFEGKINSISSSKEKIFRSTSVPNLDLNEFRNFKYKKINNSYTKINKKLLDKYFTEKSLAFWFMDDGSSKICKNGRVNIRLHTSGFDLESQKILQSILYEKFKINCKICGQKYYYLHFDKKESIKVLKIISKYFTSDLLYKTNIREKFIDLEEKRYFLSPIKIEKIEEKINSSWTMYDIEVEDNHNFFANEILISNSFETDEVNKNRIDSKHEVGCIERASGMTNFTKHSPAGRVFYDLSLKPSVLNLPQYVNPFWDEKEKKKAVKKFGGESSVGYRIFVKGEVVEEGLSVFDMARIRPFYVEDRVLKLQEVTKKKFPYFKNTIIVERPKNASAIYICSDVGEAAPTEIIVLALVNNKFKFLYNITLYSLTDKEQYVIFKYIIDTLKANFIGIDTTDGLGRAIFRRLEEIYPKENLVWCSFNEKISVDFDRDDNNNIIYKHGQPTYVEEYVSEWSVRHLKDLLYAGKIEIPEDSYKLDVQLNSVKVFQSGTRTIYECFSEENHLFQAFQVFSIAEWMNEFNLVKPAMTKVFAKGFV